MVTNVIRSELELRKDGGLGGAMIMGIGISKIYTHYFNFNKYG